MKIYHKNEWVSVDANDARLKDCNIFIGRDTVIGQDVRIGPGARIGQGAVIEFIQYEYIVCEIKIKEELK